MNVLAASLMPLSGSMSERTAYIGFLSCLALFFFTLFLPWASIPVVIVGQGTISASGWSELAYLSVLPFAGLLLNGLPNREPLTLNILVPCILLAFAMLLVDNVEHRSIWLTPLLLDAGSSVPHAVLGSVLDIGFWFALAAMVGMSVFGLVWTMHASAVDRPARAAAA